MRVAVVLTVGLILFAGCLDATPEPDRPEPEPFVPSAAAPFRILDDTPGNGTRFGLNHTELAFENTLLRYALVAAGPVNFTADLGISMGGYDREDGCIIAALNPPRDGALLLAGWAYENSYRTGIVIGGDDHTTNPFGRFMGIGSTESMEMKGTLRPGERILIEFGGRDADFLHTGTYTTDGSTENPNQLRIDLQVFGDAHLVALEPTPLRCGVGPSQGAATLEIAAPLTQNPALDATIRLPAGDNATMIWTTAGVSGERRTSLTFGDYEVQDPNLFVRSREGGHDLAVHYDLTVEPMGMSAWMLIDVYWPILQDAHR